MNTIRPDLSSRRHYLTLLDVKLGTILDLKSKGQSTRYLIIGMSLTEYALLSVYCDSESASFFTSHPQIPSYTLQLTIRKTAVQAYADCSKIIVCRFGTIRDVVKEDPRCRVDQLSEAETDKLVQYVKSSPTIAQAMKNQYFI
ncbi:MAG: hypothetical protein JNL72_13185 [Flavipsychrobacter sp.]|nr:hypothetical protein [Flavipsychrobacter sp.]